ncbi:MAG: T9SS type A sorting domain-containing protein, partial [Pedobacter sp.]|nr:T9SS type A sorting domain-containing protein [Chitinophagaceae bacterium]
QFTLPIELVSFKGSLIGSKATLQWVTATEINAKEFGIEKSSDGLGFAPIGTIAANNKSEGSSYTFDDANLSANVNYYRLKLVDKDGSFKYSNVVALKSNNALITTLSLFPNPVINAVTVSHSKAENGAILQVVSINGKTIATYNVATNATQTSIDASLLLSGQYIINYTNKQQHSTVTFIK